MKTPRLIHHLTEIGVPDEVMAEPYGIRLGYPGGRAARRLYFDSAAHWLALGMLDRRPDTGRYQSMALVSASNKGWYAPPEGDTCALWCRIVVAVFCGNNCRTVT